MNPRVVFESVIAMLLIKNLKKNHIKIFVEGLNIILAKSLDYDRDGAHAVFQSIHNI